MLVTWTSSVFRAFSSETEKHPPGGLARFMNPLTIKLEMIPQSLLAAMTENIQTHTAGSCVLCDTPVVIDSYLLKLSGFLMLICVYYIVVDEALLCCGS